MRQRQTGQHALPLPAHPVGLRTAGSGGAVLTGQVEAATIGSHDGQQYAAESERLRKARLRVEKAIKVRGSAPQRPRWHRLARVPLWLSRAGALGRAG